ncbi:MAG: LacI family DNA-binding transcriptional regulator [Bacteroidales bacterium]|nr:LacI family DNA-binding transcriptional regulator [Bacteroidales bacterium]
MKKEPSLSDVAMQLGVSKTLVSFVLNNKGDEKGISKATQKKVREKVIELNYQPNQIARGLRIGKTKTIGLLVADISNPFYARIARIIEFYAEKQAYNVMFCSSDEDENREKILLQMFRERQVDGAIISSTADNPEFLRSLIRDGFPFVLIDRYFENIDCNYVVVDNYQATYTSTNYLLNKGNKNIGFITLSPSHISSLHERKAGYLGALNERKFENKSDYILEVDYSDVKKRNYQSIKNYFVKNNELTAVFITNNNLAVAVLKTLKELNINVPNDIALMTFDDIDIFRITTPSVSVVAQPVDEIGKHAVSILLKSIEEENSQFVNKILQTKLIIRESTNK